MGVVALVACGDGLTGPSDAGGSDATPAVVRVRIQGAASLGGILVWFQNPDSTLALATRTFSDGTANAYLPLGGFVTLSIDGDLWTYGGVEPGDELVLGGRFGNQKSAIDLQVPADPDAASYWIHSPCGPYMEVANAIDSARSITLGDCEARTDLLLVTRKLGFQDLAHHQAKLDIEVGTEGAAPLVRFDGPYLSPVPSIIGVTEIPGSIGFLYSHQEILGTHGVLFDSSMFGQSVIDTHGAAQTAITMPLTPGTTLATYLDDVGGSGNSNFMHVVSWAPSAGQTQLALAPLQLPSLLDVAIYGKTTHVLYWRESPAALRPEATIANLQLANGATWHAIGPRGPAAILELPVLPLAELAGLVETTRVTMLVTIHSTTGYAAYRGTLLGWFPGRHWPITGAVGVVAYNELVQNH